MALVECVDCGTEVSDLADSCPKCSRPNPSKTTEEIQAESQKSDKAIQGFVQLWFTHALLIGVVKLWVLDSFTGGFLKYFGLSLIIGPFAWAF